MAHSEIKRVQCISPSGLHWLAYKEWGERENPNVLVCVHGLTQTGDFFDELAEAFSSDMRVICPDVVGRGRSGRLLNPAYYIVPQYVSDMVTLVSQVKATQPAAKINWLGTSMGGLIGMSYASLSGNPITKLLLNDIGPTLDVNALNRIKTYVGQEVRFDTFAEALSYVRAISEPMGPHEDAQWERMARTYMHKGEDGKWIKHYDLGISLSFKEITPQVSQKAEEALWKAYDAVTCPTLVVRGEYSDLLSRETAQAMQHRGPCAQVLEISGIGHAPTFMNASQINVARNFFLG